MNSAISQMEATQDLARIRKWLALSVVEQAPPVAYAPGTCSWILQHPSFVELDTPQTSRVLWIQGHQGCGKSVLAGYIREVLTTRGNSTLSYRFERSASDIQSTPTSFASSVGYQLLERWSELTLDSRTTVYETLRSLTTQYALGPQSCPFKTLWNVVVLMLDDLSRSSRHTIVIDAMDQALFDSPSLPKPSAFFKILFNSIRKTKTKLVIFTRPERGFRTAVQHKLSISILLSKDLLLPEIITFVRGEYQHLELPDSEMDEVIETIQSSAPGSFLWPLLFLRHLAQARETTTRHERMRSSIPPSVNELHRQLMLGAAESFTAEELECRKALLLASFQAQRPLKMTEIADALSLPSEEAKVIISRLCYPLASIDGEIFRLSHPSVREFLDELHRDDDDSLGIQFSAADQLLAQLCLSCLLDERYANLDVVAHQLMVNYNDMKLDNVNSGPPDGSFYAYASRFWDHHLVRVKKPSKKLMEMAKKFLTSPQFAYWAERSVIELMNIPQLFRVSAALTSLGAWHKGLSSQDQSLIQLDKYYEETYRHLAGKFESRNKVFSGVARMALGDFYFTTGQFGKLSSIRLQVAVDLDTVLGPHHPLTLRAKSDAAFVRLSAGKPRSAHRMYTEMANKQREVLGVNSIRHLETLGYKGQAQFLMTDVEAAVITWKRASDKILVLEGPYSWHYLTTQGWYAQGLAYLGQLELALQIAESIVQKRRESFGPSDTFAFIVEVTVGEFQFLLGRRDEAIATVENALAWGRDAYPPTHLWRLDTEMTLAMVYYAAGKYSEALAMIKEMEPAVTRFDFPRYCQLTHLKSLLLLPADPDKAIWLLQSTLTECEQDQENRALLWIRLDLATLLRARNAPGDADQALANFDNLLRDVSGEGEPGLPDEPDPPALCEAAERALRLIRDRKHADTKKELDSNGLEWKRQSDFWLWMGGSYCKDLLMVNTRESF